MAWKSSGREDIQVDAGSGQRRLDQIEELARKRQEAFARALKTTAIDWSQIERATEEEMSLGAVKARAQRKLEDMLHEQGRKR